MGKTQSIQEEASKNQDFQAYLETLKDKLKAKCHDDFDEGIKSYYEGSNYRHFALSTDMRWDFRQESSFEPGRISTFVGNALDGIIGGGAPTEEVEAGLALLLKYRSVVSAVSSSIILAAMNVFSTKISINYYQQYIDAAIFPGGTLHLLTFGDSFQNKSFFNNEVIVETGIRYELAFSPDKAQVEAVMSIMTTNVERIQQYNNALLELDHAIVEGARTEDMSKLIELNNRSQFFRSLLKGAMQELMEAGASIPNVRLQTGAPRLAVSSTLKGLDSERQEVCENALSRIAAPSLF